MSSFTCLTCSVAFQDVALGRLHYKTDWHRYNLKRKVANLSPVTLEKFEERQQQLGQKEEDKQSSGDPLFCKPCNKAFSTVNAYDNHIQSKKHKDVIAGAPKQKKKNKKARIQTVATTSTTKPSTTKAAEEPQCEDVHETMEEDDASDAESWDSSDEIGLGIEECLFCSQVSSSLQENITHMTTHGFFIPDAEYISDLEGLITYLGEKVGIGHVCLWCNEKGKGFHSTKDVQRHMVDKGHCKMLHEGDIIFEYADFYDYTSSYPDGQDPQADPEEVVNPEELDGDGYSLTLPSGAVIGHRSLLRYYKQNLVPHMHDPTKKILPRMLAQYKALGWTGATGLQVAQRVKDLQYMQRLRNRYHAKLGCRNNNLRHRFRDPNGLLT
jgi:pre-60S factor REI1